jgi:hypothetical protein
MATTRAITMKVTEAINLRISRPDLFPMAYLPHVYPLDGFSSTDPDQAMGQGMSYLGLYRRVLENPLPLRLPLR